MNFVWDARTSTAILGIFLIFGFVAAYYLNKKYN